MKDKFINSFSSGDTVKSDCYGFSKERVALIDEEMDRRNLARQQTKSMKIS